MINFVSMKEDILFYEKQRFRQWWVWLLILFLNGLFIIGLYVQLVEGKPFGNNPMSNMGLVVTAILTVLFTVLLLNIKLETIVREDVVMIRFFPFHLKFQAYNWNKIAKSYIRQYYPMREFGGWGIKVSVKKNGKAYSVSGDMGLQLQLMNNDNILIGTKRPDKLKQVLMTINQYKSF